MSFFIKYIKCEMYQVAQSRKNPQRSFFHQQKMVVLLSRMPMSASAGAAVAGLLQRTFKNREMMRRAFLHGLLNAIIKMCLSSFTLLHFIFGLDVEIVKQNCQYSYIKIIVL